MRTLPPNTFPRWKNALVVVVILLAALYALPNLYGEDPAIQVSYKENVTEAVRKTDDDAILALLKSNDMPYKAIEASQNERLIRLENGAHQLAARDAIKSKLGDDATVALNLAPATPAWLSVIGANPIKLGLDLRGGVHFLIDVDVDSALARRQDGLMQDLKTTLRDEKLRYKPAAAADPKAQALLFENAEDLTAAAKLIAQRVPELSAQTSLANGEFRITLSMPANVLTDVENETVEQTISTLRNRVNELGVAEAVVQRQGRHRVVVELPGVQDTARAKDILGKTATLSFHMADDEHTVDSTTTHAPAGDILIKDKNGRPVLLKKRVILTGDAIVGATTGFDNNGRPSVNIRLGGASTNIFKKTTRDNVGKSMGVLYIETESTPEKQPDGSYKQNIKTKQDLISLATIMSPLGNSFQITGLTMNEAQNLALMLRAGALPANIAIVEERTIGPSLGAENIRRGVMSMAVGTGLVVLFMLVYYSVFGLFATGALIVNVLLLLSLLSFIGATLTLPGMAGIVLTVGMAVDANVLIFERIREEMRLGATSQAAIYRGFERAFTTILDSNVTTLIVGVILFGIGSGPIRGFAITLCIGLLTSMFTAITVTRAFVNWGYGKKGTKHLGIGI